MFNGGPWFIKKKKPRWRRKLWTLLLKPSPISTSSSSSSPPSEESESDLAPFFFLGSLPHTADCMKSQILSRLGFQCLRGFGALEGSWEVPEEGSAPSGMVLLMEGLMAVWLPESALSSKGSISTNFPSSSSSRWNCTNLSTCQKRCRESRCQH